MTVTFWESHSSNCRIDYLGPITAKSVTLEFVRTVKAFVRSISRDQCVGGTSFEDVGGSHYWENWMRVREDGAECFDNRMDFAICASHYTNSQDLRNYFFARAAVLLGEETAS